MSKEQAARLRRTQRLPLLRQRPATGTKASLIAAYAAALSITTPAFGKTPGEVHCYNGICHRVKTLDEMNNLVGSESDAITSFYDVPERDRFNTGTITSSGEEFDAMSDGHAASSLYPDGTELLVWNPKNRHAAHIRVNDFGPFYMMRTIDVTRGVAEKLDFTKTGVAKLRVAVIWAPTPAEARYSRRRVYPAVEGYLGRLDPDQLQAVKSRLIDTAPQRNLRPTEVAAGQNLRFSLKALPAYARVMPGNRPAIVKAAILNTPVDALNASRAVLQTITATSSRPPLVMAASWLVSAQAIEAASRPPAVIVAARDADVTLAIASLETVPTASPVMAALNQPVRDTLTAGLTGLEAPQPVARLSSAPSSLMWQQVLLALGVLSIAAVTWRTRVNPVRGIAGGSGTGELPHRAPLQQPARALLPSARDETEMNADEPASRVVSAPVSVAPLPNLPQPPDQPGLEGLRDLAEAHMEQFAFVEAEAAYRQLLALRETLLGAADPMTASAERQLADCLREQGRYAAAAPHYQRALATLAAAVGDLHPAVADGLEQYAVSLMKQGFGATAESKARQAVKLRRIHGAGSREHAVALSILGEALRSQGQLLAAETEHRQAWAMFVAISGQDGLDAAASMTSLGMVMSEQLRFAEAEQLLNAGTRTIMAACGPNHPATAAGYALLGDLYRRAGALDPAVEMVTHAHTIRKAVLGPRHPDTIEAELILATIATERYRFDEAQGILDRALNALLAGERKHLGPQSRIREMLVALQREYDTPVPMPMAAE